MMTRRAILLTAVWLCAACGTIRAEEPVTVRVLTYNIHHGVGTDGRLDLERLAKVIQAAKPDVVALQEVDRKTTRSKSVDQAAELGRLTGMHSAFGKAMDYAGGEYGEAILSRYPLGEVKTHPLPHIRGCEPRAALSAKIRIGGGPELLFIGTHLEHANAKVRVSQARALVKLLSKEKTPVILAGDFNATPDSRPMKEILADFTAADTDSPAPTYPSAKPRIKIDYVLLRPAGTWRAGTWREVKTEVLSESVASDHRPVLAVLEYLGRKRGGRKRGHH